MFFTCHGFTYVEIYRSLKCDLRSQIIGLRDLQFFMDLLEFMYLKRQMMRWKSLKLRDRVALEHILRR